MRPQAGRRAAMPQQGSIHLASILLLASLALGQGTRVLHQINPEELAGQVSKGVSGALSELGLPNPQSTGGGALQEGKMSSADSLPALAGLTAALAPAPLPQELAKVKNAVGTLQDSAAIVAKQFQAQQDQMAAAVNRDSTTSFKKKETSPILPVVPMSQNDLTTLTQTLQAAETVQQFLQKLPQSRINTEETPITAVGQYSTAQAPLGQFTVGSPVASLNFYQGAAKLPTEAQKTINQIVDAFTPTVNKFAQTIRGMLPAPSPPPPPPLINAAINRVGQVAVDRISQILAGDGLPQPAGGLLQPQPINPNQMGRRLLDEQMPAILEGVDPNFNPNGLPITASTSVATAATPVMVAAGPAEMGMAHAALMAPALAPGADAAPAPRNPFTNLPNSVSHDVVYPLVQAVQNGLTPVLAPAIGPNPIIGPITVTPVTEMPIMDGTANGSPLSAPVPVGQPQLPNIDIPSIAGTIRLPGVAIPRLPPIGAPLAFNPDNELIWTNPGGAGHTSALTMGRKLQQDEAEYGSPPPPPPPPPPPADGSLGRAVAAGAIVQPAVVVSPHMAEAAYTAPAMGPTSAEASAYAPAVAPAQASVQQGGVTGIGLPLPALPGVSTLGLPPLQAVTVTVNPERLFAPLTAPAGAPVTGPRAAAQRPMVVPTVEAPQMAPSEAATAQEPRPIPRPELPGMSADAVPYPRNQRQYAGRRLQQDDAAPPQQVGQVDPALIAPSQATTAAMAQMAAPTLEAQSSVAAGPAAGPMAAGPAAGAEDGNQPFIVEGDPPASMAPDLVSLPLPELPAVANLGLPPLSAVTLSVNPAELFAPMEAPEMEEPPSMQPMPQRPIGPRMPQDAGPGATGGRSFQGRRLLQEEDGSPPPPPPPPPVDNIYPGQEGIVDPALLAPTQGFPLPLTADHAMAPSSDMLQTAAPAMEAAGPGMEADASAPVPAQPALGPAGSYVSLPLPGLSGISILGLPPLQAMTVSVDPEVALAPLAQSLANPFPLPPGASPGVITDDDPLTGSAQAGAPLAVPERPVGPQGPGPVRPEHLPATQGRRLQQILIPDMTEPDASAPAMAAHEAPMPEQLPQQVTEVLAASEDASAPAPEEEAMTPAGAPMGMPLPFLPAQPPLMAAAVGPMGPAHAPRSGPGPLPQPQMPASAMAPAPEGHPVGPVQLPRPELPGTSESATAYPTTIRSYQGRRLQQQAPGPAPRGLPQQPGPLPRPEEPGSNPNAVAFPLGSRLYQGRRLTQQMMDDEEVFPAPPPPPPPPPPPADGSLGRAIEVHVAAPLTIPVAAPVVGPVALAAPVANSVVAAPVAQPTGPVTSIATLVAAPMMAAVSPLVSDAAPTESVVAAAPTKSVAAPVAAPTESVSAAAPQELPFASEAAAPQTGAAVLQELPFAMEAAAAGPVVAVGPGLPAMPPADLTELAPAMAAVLPLPQIGAGPIASVESALPAPEAQPMLQATLPMPALPVMAAGPALEAVADAPAPSAFAFAPSQGGFAFGPSAGAPAPLPNRLPELPEVQALGLPRMPEINLPTDPSELLPFTVGYGPAPGPRIAPITVTMG